VSSLKNEEERDSIGQKRGKKFKLFWGVLLLRGIRRKVSRKIARKTKSDDGLGGTCSALDQQEL